ncbi:alpha/beta hydrolase family protein [Halobacterium yunchengense]|uniref:alpha/beta hydrolase family protein n=1 Tax=Halobacterium yunchengense TaxID=3108497 RepID=UPI0030096D2A
MVPDPGADADVDAEADASTSTAREFAERFLEEAFSDAAELLAADGRDAVVDAFPEGFRRGEMDAEDALTEFRYGLYGQYGPVEGVGEVTADDSDVTVELRFADGSHDLELAVADGAVVDFALPSEYEPPAYADPDAFAERDVTVDAGDVELDGVLAVPEGDGPFPGAVLVHGAGLHDPDGTAGNSKILKDVAWGLASEGVAVLRYEKRLNDHEPDPENFTFDEVVVEDAVAAVDELAAASRVDADSLFVAGHSQGGWAAPRVADYHGDVAGVVNLDGSPDPTPDPDDDFEFLRYSIEPDGDLDEDQEEQFEAMREPFERVAAGDYDPGEEVLGKPGRWHDSLRDCDPVARLESVDAPAFVAKAGRADPEAQADIVEFHEETLAEWRDADLGDRGRVECYEDVGHYFQEGHEPTTMAHLYFADNAEGYVVADVADWIREVADA